MPRAEGTLARKLMAQALDFTPAKDSRQWFIRDRVRVDGGFNYVDTEIFPKVSVLEDKEGRLHGQRVQYGDLKVTVPGDLDIDTTKGLVTINEDELEEYWEVFFAYDQTYEGVITERRLYVRPKSEEH